MPPNPSEPDFRLDGRVAVVIGGTGVLCGRMAATLAVFRRSMEGGLFTAAVAFVIRSEAIRTTTTAPRARIESKSLLSVTDTGCCALRAAAAAAAAPPFGVAASDDPCALPAAAGVTARRPAPRDAGVDVTLAGGCCAGLP